MNLAEEIALHLKDMSPEQRTAYLEQVKRDAVEKALEEQKATIFEVGRLSTEDLQDEIAGYNPRTGDRTRYKKISEELSRRQQSAATAASRVSMSRSEFNELEQKRADLNAEMHRIGKSPSLYGGRTRIRLIQNELKKLPGQPDLIVDPEPEKKTDE